MNPLASVIVETWPYILAFLIAAAIPVRQGRAERLALGFVAVLGVAFVRGLWPSAAEPAAEAPAEWPHLLNVMGYYEDLFRREDGRWRLAERIIRDWSGPILERFAGQTGERVARPRPPPLERAAFKPKLR